MKKSFTYTMFIATLAGMGYALLTSYREYHHIATAIQAPVSLTDQMFMQILLPKIISVITLLFVILGIKNVLIGESTNKMSVPTTSQRHNARALVFSALGLSAISTISAILPYYSSTADGDALTLVATLCMLLSVVPLYILQKTQASMYWVKLHNPDQLDERQLSERLRIMQKSYWLAMIIIALFAVACVQIVPLIIELARSNSELHAVHGPTQLNLQPLISLFIMILWLPTMLAALSSRVTKK